MISFHFPWSNSLIISKAISTYLFEPSDMQLLPAHCAALDALPNNPTTPTQQDMFISVVPHFAAPSLNFF